jgi:N utilization substance protein A
VGCCVGLRGIRIQNIVNELNDEKIDVCQWVDEPKAFISNALSPAQVNAVVLNEKDNTALVSVPDKQLSLAIGKEGQNARLAAKLTGWRIDIKSSSTMEAEKATITKENEIEVGGAPEEGKEAISEVADEQVVAEPVAEVDEEAAPAEPVRESISAAEIGLLLTSKIKTEQPSSPTIRFAEDIMPSKSTSAKKAVGKKDKDVKEKDTKPKKTRAKRTNYVEEDDEAAA